MKRLPHQVWILLDTANGDGVSRGYVWWFRTRQDAIEHRKWQNSNPNNARLVGPYRCRMDR